MESNQVNEKVERMNINERDNHAKTSSLAHFPAGDLECYHTTI